MNRVISTEIKTKNYKQKKILVMQLLSLYFTQYNYVEQATMDCSKNQSILLEKLKKISKKFGQS